MEARCFLSALLVERIAMKAEKTNKDREEFATQFGSWMRQQMLERLAKKAEQEKKQEKRLAMKMDNAEKNKEKQKRRLAMAWSTGEVFF